MLIPYTICFCLQNDHVLMVYRSKKPNIHLWNGLGGKLESGETPELSVRREIREETGFSLDSARTLYFSGIVTWNKKNMNEREGMYAFIADFAGDTILPIKRETDEGILDWKSVEWMCSMQNTEVVPNIPHFFPAMLSYNVPLLYECRYVNGIFKNVDMFSLPADLMSNV